MDLILTDGPVVHPSFKLLVSPVSRVCSIPVPGKGGDSTQTPGQVSMESEIFPCGIPARPGLLQGKGTLGSH